MCKLCENPVEGKEEALTLAVDLERLAAYERAMAHGNVKPHSSESARAAVLAQSIIRRLVAEYV